MALFWTTEVFPLAATSLLSLFLIPVMGIMTAKDVSKIYMSNIILLFICGNTITHAVEKSNLHRRFSLLIVIFLVQNHACEFNCFLFQIRLYPVLFEIHI